MFGGSSISTPPEEFSISLTRPRVSRPITMSVGSTKKVGHAQTTDCVGSDINVPPSRAAPSAAVC